MKEKINKKCSNVSHVSWLFLNLESLKRLKTQPLFSTKNVYKYTISFKSKQTFFVCLKTVEKLEITRES